MPELILLINISNYSATKDCSRRSSRHTPSTSRVYEELRIFCQKSSKYQKGKKTRESLIQCTELRADSRVREAAVQKLDERILAIVSRELVAAEGHYHRSCYRPYIREKPGYSCDKEVDEQNPYNAAEKDSFNQLFSLGTYFSLTLKYYQ